MSKGKQTRQQVPPIAGAARKARATDKQLRKLLVNPVTADSFQNFAAKLGIGTDNLTSASTYGFNPISRQRTILEWIHRGSWLGGVAVDIIADDMTRAGVDVLGNLPPDQIEAVNQESTRLHVWNKINETIKWARLYGGCICVLLINGQDPSTPLRIETVGKGDFLGLLPLDRWMVEPDLTRRVRDIGPFLGQPEFYRVVATAPALVGMRIHYTRCIRLLGIELPYWQAMMENLWGISVLERLYDRMVAYDSATTGVAQLIYKAYLRTMKIEGLRDLVATGTDAQLNGLTRYVDMARRFQTVEGFTLIDAVDEFGEHTGAATSFAGIGDAMLQIGQQLSGALEIPLVRLFGQSPAGLNATGESDLRMYYDGIAHRQVKETKVSVTTVFQCLVQSCGFAVPKGFGVRFRPLWQLTETEKADIAGKVTDGVSRAVESIGLRPKVAMQELRQSAEITGIYSNITDEDIEAADEMPVPDAMEEEGAQQEEGSLRTGDSIAAVAWHHGLQAVVETPKGTVRRGSNWQVYMPADYGYLRGTTGTDGDQVDCFIGPSPESGTVFVINQVDPATGKFDEHKCMLGYYTQESALEDFVAAHNGNMGLKKLGSRPDVVQMEMRQFKQWLAAGQFEQPVRREAVQ